MFGRLAVAELRARGHEPVAVHRHGRLRTDAGDAASVVATARTVQAEALFLAAGPTARILPGAARAAIDLALPYVDIAEEGAYHMRIRELESAVPLLTGMSTTPALAEALAAVVTRRAPRAAALRATLFGESGNARGRATLDFAVSSRERGPGVAVDLPGFGVPRVYPARAAFTPASGKPARFYVGLTGLPGIGWRWARLPGVRLLAALVPPMGGTAGLLAVDALSASGHLLAREGIRAGRDSQRMAVLPAVWALEEALAGRAPRQAALPAEWVDPDALLSFLAAGGMERFREE